MREEKIVVFDCGVKGDVTANVRLKYVRKEHLMFIFNNYVFS